MKQKAPVKQCVGEAVVPLVQPGDVAEIAFGNAGYGFEYLEEEFVWEDTELILSGRRIVAIAIAVREDRHPRAQNPLILPPAREAKVGEAGLERVRIDMGYQKYIRWMNGPGEMGGGCEDFYTEAERKGDTA